MKKYGGVGILLLCSAVAILLCFLKTNNSKQVMPNYFSNDINEVRAAYRANASAINNCDDEGVSPLMFAAIQNNTDAINFLLEHKADPNKELKLAWTILGVSVDKGNLKAVKLLLKHDVDVNKIFIVEDKDRSLEYTPLMLAIAHQNYEITKKLIEAGADINLTTNFYHKDGSLQYENVSPLLVAVSANDMDTVKLLVDAGGDVNKNATYHVFDDRKELLSPLMIAIQAGNMELVKFLVKHGANISLIAYNDTLFKMSYVTPVTIAIKYERLNILKYLVEHKASLLGASYWAFAFSRNWDIVEYLAQVTTDDFTKELKQILAIRETHISLFASMVTKIVKDESDFDKLIGTNLSDAINLWSILSLIPEKSRSSLISGHKTSNADLQNALIYAIAELEYRNMSWEKSNDESRKKLCDYFAIKTGANDSFKICALFIQPEMKFLVIKPYIFPE